LLGALGDEICPFDSRIMPRHVSSDHMDAITIDGFGYGNEWLVADINIASIFREDQTYARLLG
jgi:hypothetical protein